MTRARRSVAVFFAAVSTLAVSAVQAPFASTANNVLSGGGYTEWSLDVALSPDGTDHLVFDTAYSLLQHWPSNRMRNGHNIVPGTIPKGTLLHHGTSRNEIPSGSEWVALDPEHAYRYCVERDQQGCWQLTLATTRPLKVVYFDGMSAKNLPSGTLDTQDLLIWGEPRPEYMLDEKIRITTLCAWGKKFGIDGIVRAEMSFEIMLCDFSSGVTVVSFTNLVYNLGIRADTTERVVFESLYTGSWHNHFPGETRIQLDLAGLVSFYDTQLVPSLVPVRAGQKRVFHRAGNASHADLSTVMSRLEWTLSQTPIRSSGIDWRTFLQVVVDRYAGRLELTRHLLNSTTTSPDVIMDLANKTQTQLRIMLTPYLLFSATPTDPSDETVLAWTAPIYKRCATTHTAFMETLLDSTTDSEKLLLRAVRGTSREICRVVTKMWAAGVYAGIDFALNTKESLDVDEVAQVWNVWREDLSGLMAWLDWSIWAKCTPGCGPEALCSMFRWPIKFPRTYSLPVPSADSVLRGLAPDQVPEPKCVSRVDP